MRAQRRNGESWSFGRANRSRRSAEPGWVRRRTPSAVPQEATVAPQEATERGKGGERTHLRKPLHLPQSISVRSPRIMKPSNHLCP